MSTKTPKQIRAELAELHEEHDGLLDEIFENAGEADLYGSSGPEDLAVAYVRRLETEAAKVVELRQLVAEILESYEAVDARGPATRVRLAKWHKRAGLTQ